MASHRLSGAALALALMHAGCDGSRALDPTPAAPEPPSATAGAAEAQALPHAVFRTTPGDVDGRIAGGNPLEVQFNMCQSRPADPDDELKFTYDFDADGTADEIGHCRARHTFTAPASARVCVSDRRPGGIVCRTYRIDPAGEEDPSAPEYVLTLSLNTCGIAGVRYQYLNASVAPTIPAGQSYSLSVTVDGELGDADFRATLANVGQFECVDGGWQPQTFDRSPLPNDHLLEMLGASCPQRNFFVSSAIDHYPPIIVSQLRTTVTAFQVPGRRARIEGPTTFTCP